MHSDLPPLAILAGGLATRMRPATNDVPKSMLKISGEPFVAHQLRLLVGQGIEDIVICCGHFGDQIEAFAGDGARFGCHIRYSYDGNSLLGTGGALRRAVPLLGDSFFVMYGDSYLLANPVRAWRAFLLSGRPALMTVVRSDRQWDASNVEAVDGEILFYDKHSRTPRMRHVDYGLSLMRSSVLAPWPDDERFDLADVMRDLATNRRLAAHEVHTRFYEIGSPEGFRATEQMLEALRKSRESELLSLAGCER
ncbi:NTP transferase domain-containing protein [Alloacidobacterium dinghuense]|uniref:NTP transferase domain-containing protein n=1 Tax=Alloacidobacterium dinghuense TaxID=2763107 RepID=A0A7G8BJH5_9BACT|nr:NTP transferase domain-containing protein [Alloacidobacterium dinghuense]QNI32695.1 NTP transferase domain-containing protein [Alloacidobacterium dinghuense]